MPDKAPRPDQELRSRIGDAPVDDRTKVSFIKAGSGWLTSAFAERIDPPLFDAAEKIESLAKDTQKVGRLPLWDGYDALDRYRKMPDKTRSPNMVRTGPILGRLYTWLVQQRRSEIVVEFGTAFGVSGMYWLAGLEMAACGKLVTFEPNDIWSEIADINLQKISLRYKLIKGTFEENAPSNLSLGSVDIGFIDAIHTSEFVFSQYEILKLYMRPNGLIIFDDIAFSADMTNCWAAIARKPEINASLDIGQRLGIVELGPNVNP